MLEERGGWQQDVGVIGCVGEKLLVNHGKQIRALKPANHFIVIRANRSRI
jgi:hypothetical protein